MNNLQRMGLTLLALTVATPLAAQANAATSQQSADANSSYVRLGYSAFSALDPNGAQDATGSGFEAGLRLTRSFLDLTVNHSEIIYDFDDNSANIDFGRTLGEVGLTFGREYVVSGRLGLGFENLDLEGIGEVEGFIPRIGVWVQPITWIGFGLTVGYTEEWDFEDADTRAEAEATDYQLQLEWRTTEQVVIYGRYQRTEIEIGVDDTDLDHLNVGVQILF